MCSRRWSWRRRPPRRSSCSPTWPSPFPVTPSSWPIRPTTSSPSRRGGSRWASAPRSGPRSSGATAATFERPVARMRELVGALRAILAAWETGERLDVRGEFYTHTLMPPTFNPGPNPFGTPPIFLGGLGPQMVRLAAEVADGLLVMPFNSERHFHQRTLPAVAEGLRRAGRDRSQLSGDGRGHRGLRGRRGGAGRGDGRRPLAAGLLRVDALVPAGPRSEGWEDIQPELNAMSKSGRWAEMPGLLDDAMVSTLAAVGSPAEVAAQVRRAVREPRGADRVLHARTPSSPRRWATWLPPSGPAPAPG